MKTDAFLNWKKDDVFSYQDLPTRLFLKSQELNGEKAVIFFELVEELRTICL